MNLTPTILQDARNGNILMVAYTSEEALKLTRSTGYAWFYSRSRATLWMKGETSGHRMKVLTIEEDCDGDTLLIQVIPEGPACHSGSYSCFGGEKTFVDETKLHTATGSALEKLESVIASRKASGDEVSYTYRLIKGGLDRVLKKVGEEAGEVIIAAKNDNPTELIYESADWLYHWMVLLAYKEIPLREVLLELEKRLPFRQ